MPVECLGRSAAKLFCPSQHVETALPLFCKCLLQHVMAKLDIGVHLFQTCIFLLQLFHPCHQRGVHTTELCPPLVNVALLIPCSRQSSVTGTPSSACFKIARIWLSEKLDIFMQNLRAHHSRKSYLETLLFSGGITLRVLPYSRYSQEE